MDISALSLALGAPTEPTGQSTGEPGFEVLLAQVEVGGFVPTGAPPGPEPPPDILLAGEEVEVLEPNAQPQQLDFQPLPKIELDIDLPQPFWENPVLPEIQTESDVPRPVDEAMAWLASQMSGGFFATPVVPTPEAVTAEAAKPITIEALTNSPVQPNNLNGFQSMSAQSEKAFPLNTDTKVVDPFAKPLQLGKLVLSGVSEGTSPLAVNPAMSAELNVVSVQPFLESEAVVTADMNDPRFGVNSAANSNTEGVVIGQENNLPVSCPTPNGSGSEYELPFCPTLDGGDGMGLGNPSSPVTGTNSDQKLIDTGSKVPDKLDVSRVEHSIPGKTDYLQKKPTGSVQATTEDPAQSSVLEVIAPEQSQGKGQSEGKGNSFGQHAKGEAPFGHQVRNLASELNNEQLEAQTGLQLGRPERLDSGSWFANPMSTAGSTVKPAALPPAEIDLVVKQVADKLQMLAAARPKNGVTIHLNPQDLGSITVVVRSIGRMVDTQLTASDARVADALDQNQTRLIEMMDSRGFQVQSVTVSQQSNHSTNQDSKPAWQQSSQQQSQNQSQSGNSHGHRGHGNQHFDQPKSDIRAWVRRGEGFDFSF